MSRFGRWFWSDPDVHFMELLLAAGLIAYAAVCVFAPQNF